MFFAVEAVTTPETSAGIAWLRWWLRLFCTLLRDAAQNRLMRPNVIYTIFHGRSLAVHPQTRTLLCLEGPAVDFAPVHPVPGGLGLHRLVIILVFRLLYWQLELTRRLPTHGWSCWTWGCSHLPIHPFFRTVFYLMMSSRSTGSFPRLLRRGTLRHVSAAAALHTKEPAPPAAVFFKWFHFYMFYPLHLGSWAGSGRASTRPRRGLVRRGSEHPACCTIMRAAQPAAPAKAEPG